MNRRTLLRGMAAAVAVPASGLATAGAAEDKVSPDSDAEKIVDFLFVQNAKNVTLKDGLLTLAKVVPDTLYFSDRPERIVGRITNAQFVEQWAKGDDSFKKDPPNAVLTVIHKQESEDVVVILKSPRIKGENLIYDVVVTDGKKSIIGGSGALFIDVIGRPLTPLSYAGVARRTRRRTVRRVERRR